MSIDFSKASMEYERALFSYPEPIEEETKEDIQDYLGDLAYDEQREKELECLEWQSWRNEQNIFQAENAIYI